MFTGDLQEQGIETLLEYYNLDTNPSFGNVLDVDVYQVGHHASHNATTKALLKAMTPEVAVIFRWLVAASIILLIGISSFFYINNSHVSYETGAGELKTIVLADGSVITLNAMSVLVVPKNFNKNTRTLELHGEAFFKVVKDSLRPFIVKTATSQTKVFVTRPKNRTI